MRKTLFILFVLCLLFIMGWVESRKHDSLGKKSLFNESIELTKVNETGEYKLMVKEKVKTNSEENSSIANSTSSGKGNINSAIKKKSIFDCNFKDNNSNDMCYLKLSEEYPNNYYCNYLKNEKKRNTCRTEWALKKNDTYYCAIQPFTYSIECYNQFIGIIKDTSICNILVDIKLKKCLSEINNDPFQEKKEEACKTSGKRASWEDCIKRFAVAMKDKTWCVKAEYDDDCYLNYVISTLDENVCERIKAEDREDLCYKAVAIQKKDKQICEKIRSKEESDKNTRVECRLAVSEALNESLDLG